MRLKNKKTGEMGDLIIDKALLVVRTGTAWLHYASLAELNSEWEDAPEEPKMYWCVNGNAEIISMRTDWESPETTEACKQIGNYFETREEAEKAVEKLKAWKRLKDKGYKLGMDLSGVYGTTMVYGIKITASEYDEVDDETRADLDLLFGGVE